MPHFTESIVFLQDIFYDAFSARYQNVVEILLMITSGHISDIYTPNQLAQILSISKDKIYDTVRTWSIFLYRKLLFSIGCQIAVKMIKDKINKSPSTLSKLRITINVDDTIISRMVKLIGLTYSWFSCKMHKTIQGQNIIILQRQNKILS